MDTWTSMLVYGPQLPQYCEPENAFLHWWSSTFHSCVPTNLAFISTLLGALSITSWLCAQFPQVWKNFQLKSTSGLSIFFLAEWFLGDISNLFGTIFAKQTLWQTILACYYCFVDCMLVGQWLWYEQFEHGSKLRSVWARRKDRPSSRDNDSIVSDALDTVSIMSSSLDPQSPDESAPGTPKPIPTRTQNMFHTPNFSRSPSVNDFSSANNTPTSRNLLRPGRAGSPAPSPRTILFISLLLAVLSTATPVRPASPFAPLDVRVPGVSVESAIKASSSGIEIAGKFFSWVSAALYLGSRLPQLYKNHVRRSTAGLSPALFAAAFFGNLFYSSSVLTNPCAWNDFPKGDTKLSRGWVGPEGSDRQDWIIRTTPFFVGAAGVLFMDAMIGFQFMWFGSHDEAKKGGEHERIVVVVVPDEDGSVRKDRGKRWRWRKVNGWMRGWVPSVAAVGTLVRRPQSPSEGEVEERTGLLNDEGDQSDTRRAYGGVRQ